ncbi:MAG: hypothetical protein AAF997_19050 [Myxococcota bacterium]
MLLEDLRAHKRATNVEGDRSTRYSLARWPGSGSMWMKTWQVLGLSCLMLPLASAGRAQVDESVAPEPAPTVTSPTITREMVEAPPPEELVRDESHDGVNVGFTWALQVGVPIFLDVDRDVVKAGGDVSFFAAADFGFFLLGGGGGVGWNRINLNNQTEIPFGGTSPLSRVFLSVPDIRFQLEDLKVVLPYFGASFDMNFWNFRETEPGCIDFYCTDVSVYRFTPGFTVRAGLGFEVSKNIYVDTGLRYSYSGEGNFFNRTQQWLTPYFGVLIRAR